MVYHDVVTERDLTQQKDMKWHDMAELGMT